MKTLDPRVQYSTGRGNYTCNLTGNVYEYSDRASNEAAFKLLNENAMTYIRAAEKQAGKTLTASELAHGVAKTKAPLAEEIARQSAAANPPKDAPPENPYAKAADELAEYKRRQKPASLQKETERLSAEWEAKQQAARDREAMLAQPARVKLLESVAQRLRDIKFQTVSESEVRRLQDMQNALTAGAAVSEVRQSYNVYAEEKRVQKSAALQERQQQIDALQSDLESLRDIPDAEAIPAPVYVPATPKATAPEVITAEAYREARIRYEQSSDFSGRREFT